MTTAVVSVVEGNPTVTINHNTYDKTAGTAVTATKDLASANQSFSVISGVTRDDYGHISSVETSTITINKVKDSLKQDTTISPNAVTINTLLADANNSTNDKGNSSLTLSSGGSIALTSTTANNATSVSLDVVWGTF